MSVMNIVVYTIIVICLIVNIGCACRSIWLLKKIRKHYDRIATRPQIAPDDIESDDPVEQIAVARAWNTGNLVIGHRDETGHIYWTEQKIFPWQECRNDKEED